jgi:hypothetical protein
MVCPFLQTPATIHYQGCLALQIEEAAMDAASANDWIMVRKNEIHEPDQGGSGFRLPAVKFRTYILDKSSE